MKIAQMTWFHHHNYGTALQLYALNRYLSDLGHSVSVVNYISESINDNVFIPEPIGLNFVKNKISSKYYRARHHIYDTGERAGKFYSFVSRLSFTEKCQTHSDLVALNDQYDAFVCGSDQIWSPLNYNPRYFLDYVIDENKMIAYAPSFGTSEIKDPYVRTAIGKNVARFKHISIREKQGVKIAQSLTDAPVFNCVDPTLLLEEESWNEIAHVKDEKKYLLCYFLGGSGEFYSQASKLAAEFNLAIKIIPVFSEDLKRKGVIKEAVGPEEFVSLIKNADYICTDSFHGSIFSIIYHKQFTVFERFKKNSALNQNSRIHNLLSQLDLKSRLFGTEVYAPKDKIDYVAVDNLKQELIIQSKEFLDNSLQQCINSNMYQRTNIGNYGQLCAGCGSCVLSCSKNAISMNIGRNGFFQAEVNSDKCINCGFCLKTCPMINNTAAVSVRRAKMSAIKASDKSILIKSSSGGAGYILAKHLAGLGYDVVGCVYNEEKECAEHIVVSHTTSERVQLFQGSKYLQSNFLNFFSQIKDNDNPLAVFGTPCQIAGFRNYISLMDKGRKVVYIDLICHGVPSNNGWEKYKLWLRKTKGLTNGKVGMSFRYKEKGWHEKYVLIETEKGRICEPQDDNYFFRFFEACNGFLESCYECRWRDKSCADLRIGDYWGSRFAEDNEGVSMVMSFSSVGNGLLGDILENGSAHVDKMDIEDYYVSQQTRNLQKPVYYDFLMKDLADDSIDMKRIDEMYVSPLFQIKKLHKSTNRVKDIIKYAR